MYFVMLCNRNSNFLQSKYFFPFLDTEKQKRWVEITYIAHTHPKIPKIEDGIVDQFNALKNESQGGPVVLNYRFLREFTKGIDPSTTNWTISAINHFRLNDLVD